MTRYLLTVLILLVIQCTALAQNQDTLHLKDTTAQNAQVTLDTAKARKYSPRTAAILSAILPGAGQVYNKKYWKVPIVYAAVGIPAYFFFDNKKWYERTRDAAKMINSGDTMNYRNRVDPKLYVFFENGQSSLNSLLNYRNQFRRNMDYSVLFVLLFWGLNVVDATVDAHLKGFNISNDLSLKIKPTFLSGATTAGVSFVFNIGRNHVNALPSLR